MAAAEVKSRHSIPLLALGFSLALHAAAFAALLADWRQSELEEPVLSIELVIVSAPIEAPTIEQEPAPAAAAPATQEPQPTPPPAPVVEQTPPPPPEPEKFARKPEPPKPEPVKPAAPKPQPAPARAFEPPINLNPGTLGGEQTQQAKAPSGFEAPAAFSVLHGPIPPYPPLARSRGQEGRVVLDVTIGIDGVPISVVVGRSSGAPLLDESAVTTVKTWRFRNESNRVLSLSVPIVFELRATAGR
jgi:protein TonB